MQAAIEDDLPARLNMREAEAARIAATPEELDPRALALLPSNDPRRIRFQAEAAQRLQEAEAAHAAARAAELPPSAANCRTALRAAVAKYDAAKRRLADLTRAMPQAENAAM